MKTNLWLLAISLAMTSCGGQSEDNSTSEEAAVEASSFHSDCIMSYQDRYDELLPLEQIQKHYSGDLSAAKMKYRKSEKAKDRATDKYVYEWESDRIRKMDVLGVKMEVPVQNEIGIQWLGSDLFMIGAKDGNPLENFKHFYRNVSKDELDAAMAKAEEVVKEKELASENQTESAMEMAKGLAADAKFESVDGVGTAASWVVKENHLVVLVGDKTFQVIANVSSESEANKKLAIELAHEVLSKCQ